MDQVKPDLTCVNLHMEMYTCLEEALYSVVMGQERQLRTAALRDLNFIIFYFFYENGLKG